MSHIRPTLCAFFPLLAALVCLSPASGQEIDETWRGTSFTSAVALSIDWRDNSCWVADSGGQAVIHISPGGDELLRQGGFSQPVGVAANPLDHTCWVIDRDPARLLLLDADGRIWVNRSGLNEPTAIASNPKDGSCWVADAGYNQVIHFDDDGRELNREDGFADPAALAVNPKDGSCWVADTGHGEVVHLAADGSELSHTGDFTRPQSVSINPVDGSCWVADPGAAEIVHLAEDGSVIWRGGDVSSPQCVSVNPLDGTLWIADGPVFYLDPDGSLIWESEDPTAATFVVVNPMDGSCWAAAGDTVFRFAILDYPAPTFPDVPPCCWAFSDIEACCCAGIVKGYDDDCYHPEWTVTRAEMAVYITRSVLGGDEHVPTGPATATFLDVPNTYWAYDEIEYVCAQNIAQGYEYEDPEHPGETLPFYEPTWPITRDQMAVYISRALAGGDDNVPPGSAYPTPSFADVDSDNWAYNYIEYAAQNNVVQGYEYPDPDNPGETLSYYKPLWPVTRDQMAVYIARAFNPLP
jgi:DNA-binding beta-propeller fold protein YncE